MNKHQLTLANAFLEASTNLSGKQHSVLRALLSLIQQQGDLPDYTVSAKEIAEIAEIKSSNLYRDIEPAVKAIKRLEWSFNDDVKEEADEDSPLYKYKYKNGLFTKLKISDRLKSYIFIDHSEGHYLKPDLANANKLSGKYTGQLYILLKQRLKYGSRRFTIEEFRTVLAIPQKHTYKDIRVKIIDPCIKKINTTDIEVSYSAKTNGRRSYQSITFLINKNYKDELAHFDSPELKEFAKMLKTNGVKLYIINNVIKKYGLNTAHMFRYWREFLREDAELRDIECRGIYIKNNYDLDNKYSDHWRKMALKYATDEYFN